jgi:uncharacterized protein YecT (DUF1311 family)
MKYCLIAMVALLSCSIYAQDKKDTIDIQLQACLDSSQNQTTVGMIDCEGRAAAAWDKQLNKYYKLLMGVLTGDEKEKLKTSQLNWLKFRDSENDFSSTMYTDMQGTMWRVSNVGAEVDLIKRRALELKSYYEDKTSQ